MDRKIQTEFWKGQSLELQTPSKETYFTQLLNHEQMLTVQKPVNSKNVPMIIENGASVAVYFQDEVEGLCVFISKIYQLQNGRIIIDKPSEEAIKKAQRRRFFRVKVSVDLQLFIQSADDLEQVTEISALTHDISGGGLSFLTREKLVNKDDVVQGIVHLKLGSKQLKVRFKGEIVRVTRQDNQFYKNSLQFIDMNESSRAEIIQYCMIKQVEFHRKVKGID